MCGLKLKKKKKKKEDSRSYVMEGVQIINLIFNHQQVERSILPSSLAGSSRPALLPSTTVLKQQM
jgi:hypothetical protein